jgi:regulator of protease activity HflC (stomatin/prohibitin superfamily)
MKKLTRSFSTIGLLAAVAFSTVGCDSVKSGYVGVEVQKYGDDRGVQEKVLGPGRYWVGWNADIFDFPTFTITDTYAGPQAITFQTTEGTDITADFGINFHIKKENVPKVFQAYRRGVDELSDVVIRNMVRDSVQEAASKRTMDDMMLRKEAFLKDVQKDVIETAATRGISVESVTSLGGFRWPQKILDAMNAKMQATQDAMRVENEIRKTEAEARKRVVNAEANVKVAEADAKAVALRGEALNKNPQVLQQMAIEKWNGVMPTVTSGATPFVTIK